MVETPPLTSDPEALFTVLHELGITAVVGLHEEPAATLLVIAAAEMVLAALDTEDHTSPMTAIEAVMGGLKTQPIAPQATRAAMARMVKNPAEVGAAITALAPALSDAIKNHHERTGAGLYGLYLLTAAYLIRDAADGLDRVAKAEGLEPLRLAATMMVTRLLI